MVATRDLANKRIQICLAPLSSFANLDNGYVTDLELQSNTVLKAAPAIRWDGLDFGMQASDQIDDRSLDDDGAAIIRGFAQFGGKMPAFFPKKLDSSSILRQVFNLVKTQGTELGLIERVGWLDRRAAFAAGQTVNIYKVMTDGFMPDTEGTGRYAYLQNMIPRGSVFPWSIVANGTTPAAVAIAGAGTLALTVGNLALRRATYQGNDITSRATWVSSDPTVAKVDNRGIIEGIKAGTANITASYPGGTASTALAVTVS
jgi:hypothetical protein